MSHNPENSFDPMDAIIKDAPHVHILKDPENHSLIRETDIIWGYDISTKSRAIFFGINKLENIVHPQAERCSVLAFKYDSSTPELVYFYNKIVEAKGSCDFALTREQQSQVLKTVSVYDFETKTLQTIPASELAEGYVLAEIKGLDRLVYVKAEGLLKDLPQRHKSLSEECHSVLRYYVNITKNVDFRSFEDHLKMLLTENDPRRELIVLFHIASVYRHFAKTKIISKESRLKLFQLVLKCSLAERHTVLEIVNVAKESLPLAREIVAYYYDYDLDGEFSKRFDADKMTSERIS
jgi:hypothetical protein